MTVLFRVDASTQMGVGHVMRCLTLADEVKRRGFSTLFLYREQSGHLGDTITTRGHDTIVLPKGSESESPAVGVTNHANWLGVSQEEDAAQSRAALQGRSMTHLVIDHYALDHRWRRAMGSPSARTLIIDDLVDRVFEADLLLNQNLGRLQTDYDGRVPDDTLRLIGPHYALLRPQFAAHREASLALRSVTAASRPLRILLTMGGVDQPNATAAVLTALNHNDAANEIEVEVVLGTKAPNLKSVQALCDDLAPPCSLSVGVDDMAARMAAADIAIGAAGGTTWERCALGLPSLLATIADNQAGAAETVEAAGAAISIGWPFAAGFARRVRAGVRRLSDDTVRAEMALSAANICDGKGAARVADALLER